MIFKNQHLIIRLFAGFSVVGFFVTLVSIVLSYVFLKILGTPLILTFVLMYGSTILLSFFLNSKYIFKTGVTFHNLLIYFLVYGTGMLIGTGLLALFRILLPFENWILAYLVLPFTILSNFSLSYWFLKPQKKC